MASLLFYSSFYLSSTPAWIPSLLLVLGVLLTLLCIFSVATTILLPALEFPVSGVIVAGIISLALLF